MMEIRTKVSCIICTFLLCTTIAKSQIITGRWQGGTSKLSNENLENYQFFSDGSFIFNTAGDDGLTSVLKINGTYKISNNNIYFVTKTYDEFIKGNLKFSGDEPGTAAWRFENASSVTIKLTNVSEQKASLKLYQEKNLAVLEIDGNRYYKINKDPNKY